MVVSGPDIIFKYFNPAPAARQKLMLLGPLYTRLNQEVNVISRKDIDAIYVHHVLHSLALARLDPFVPGDRILDLGTGGGFPGIPLAIMYPDCHFTLIDGTLKKIQIVKTVIENLELTNVNALWIRAENVEEQYDYVISRAVASAAKIWRWSQPLLKPGKGHKVFLLKGGDLTDELKDLQRKYFLYPIGFYFQETYFEEKYILAF